MSTNLPATILAMAKGLAVSISNVAPTGGTYMKFTKFGTWVYGKEEAQICDKSQWVVHPEGFRHGWVAWGDDQHGTAGEKLGEVMTLASEPLRDILSLPEVNGKWTQQIGMSLLCIDGGDQPGDKGVICNYTTNSLGGKKLYQHIGGAVLTKLTDGAEAIAPVVMLAKSSYKHSKFGTVMVPEVKIIDWMGLEELAELVASADEEAPLPEDEQAAAFEEVEEEPAPVAPAPRTRAAAPAKTAPAQAAPVVARTRAAAPAPSAFAEPSNATPRRTRRT